MITANQPFKKTKFKNKVIIVTGCNGQLGKAICKMFLGLDSKVFGLDITENRFKSKKFTFIKCDISKKINTDELVKKILKNEKKINILINNAGSSIFTPYKIRKSEEIDQVINANLKGTLNMILSVVNLSRKKTKKINILNIASIYGASIPNFTIYENKDRINSEIYGSTKASIIHLSKYFAKILGPNKVICNSLSPGGILNKKIQRKSFIKKYSSKTPLRRMGLEKDILNGIYFLTHDDNTYTTGQNLVVDGGFTL
jgi:NAD(P)-dependent dehydrogenase (short-subunit alcohol dehydrogenase family)